MERTQLDFFWIDGKYYGGDQKWHSRFLMNIGGCSAVSACEVCIYLAKTMPELRALYPFDPENVTRDDFLKFFEIMFEYIYPGMGGLTSINKFARMLGRYAETTGAKTKISTLSGSAPYAEAEAFAMHAIDAGLPVMYLLLSHSDLKFDEYEWHWFTLTGYEKTEAGMDVTFATWGKQHRFSLKKAWDTGKVWRGGMVCMEPEL